MALVPLTSADQTGATLVVACVGSYVIGSSVSYAVLRRVVGALPTAALLGFMGRLSIAAIVASSFTGALAFWLAQFPNAERSR